MDQILNYLAGTLGVDSTTFLLVLAVVIAVCNLLGKLIPDDATGALGLLRKICKVFGLYLSNRVASGVSVNDTARAVAARYLIVRSPIIVGLFAIVATLLLSACSIPQLQLTTDAVCSNVPLAQKLLDAATKSGKVVEVQKVLDRISVICPGVLQALDTAKATTIIIDSSAPSTAESHH